MAVENDPVIKQFREQISDIDLKTLELINKRIKLVSQLWTYKHEQNVEVYEPAREDWLVTYAARANRGPLSTEALSEIYRHIIEVTQHEARAALPTVGAEAPPGDPAGASPDA
jgi:chorismate mutase